MKRNGATILMECLLEQGVDFDCVICDNDEMALGVIEALEAAGYTGLVGYELFPARSTREAVKAILDAG